MYENKLEFKDLENEVLELYSGCEKCDINVNFLRECVNILNERIEANNENQSFTQLFNYCIFRIKEKHGHEIAKRVLAIEGKWFVDELRNGMFNVSLHGDLQDRFKTLNEAVNYIFSGAKSRKPYQD